MTCRTKFIHNFPTLRKGHKGGERKERESEGGRRRGSTYVR
jgi:hypothetical protein